MYLSKGEFKECAMRKFNEHEYHVTRVFNYSVLILMISGVLRFREDGKDIELGADEYYIQKQGLLQEGIFPSDSAEYFYVHFDGTFSETDGKLPIRGKFHYIDTVSDIYKLEQMYMLQLENEFALNGVFYSILGSLGENSQKRSSGILKDMSDYIYQHYLEPDFNIENMTGRFSYSKDYIIKMFKNEFSATPYQYITKLRIEYAKQIILSTSRKLTEIYGDCGYSDYSVFYKNFVNVTGKSPQEWSRIYK